MQNKLFLDEIVSIEEYANEETIDITVDDNNLFFANGILTHNSGISNSDISMTEMAESIGIAYTADFILAGYSNDEMKAQGKMLFKQLKNRYGDVNWKNKFMIGVERSKMRLFNLANSETETTAPTAYDSNERILDAAKDDYDYSQLIA